MGKYTFFALFFFIFSTNLHAAASLPPDLKISVASSPEQVQFGEEFSFEYTWENIGETSSSNVSFSMAIPLDGSLVSVTTTVGNCDAPTGSPPKIIVKCNLGIVAPAATGNITMLWRAPEIETELLVFASVSATGENNSTVDDNQAELATNVISPPDNGGAGDPNDNGGQPADDGGAEAAGDQGGCALNGQVRTSYYSAFFMMCSLAMLAAFRLLARRSS